MFDGFKTAAIWTYQYKLQPINLTCLLLGVASYFDKVNTLNKTMFIFTLFLKHISGFKMWSYRKSCFSQTAMMIESLQHTQVLHKYRLLCGVLIAVAQIYKWKLLEIWGFVGKIWLWKWEGIMNKSMTKRKTMFVFLSSSMEHNTVALVGILTSHFWFKTSLGSLFRLLVCAELVSGYRIWYSRMPLPWTG